MKLISGLQPHQVLQRIGTQGANLKLMGKTESSEAITVSVNDAKGALAGLANLTANLDGQGGFEVSLSNIPVGGPYTLTITQGLDNVEISPFFCGDVWVLAGQSNMQGVGSMSQPAEPHPLVQVFSMRRVWRLAEDPLHIRQESPDPCHNLGAQFTDAEGESYRKSAPTGVSAGIYFAREMIDRTGVPQGLIATAHGGTSMAQWSPERAELEGDSLYWSMVESVRQTGQPVTGMLWYQGESDTSDEPSAVYTERMQALVAASRRDLNAPELPWVIVQIGRVYGSQNTIAWNSIQDQQQHLPDVIPNLQLVASIDLPMDDMIHIGSTGFPRLGKRLATVAHGMIDPQAPALRSPQVDFVEKVDSGDGICRYAVHFKHANELKSEGRPHGFALIDQYGKELPLIYKITLSGNTVLLDLFPAVSIYVSSCQLSYGHGTTPYCNIVNEHDLPVPVFGPIWISEPTASTTFFTEWKLSEPQQIERNGPGIPPPPADLPTENKTYGSDGFVNEHDNWSRKTGFAYFFQTLHLSEPMTLDFKMGYDGPFAMWINGEALFSDPNGVNPCVPDKASRTRELPAGNHEMCVGMDVANGIAWGFFLRIARTDLTGEQIESGDYILPVKAPTPA
ncbi:MAG: sialate O-acetylesterase [Puniceicoccales bacterium]